jgi:type I restriction enzyme M protein
MIQVVAPKIGERIYDGACGSAGFLREAFDYLQRQPNLTTSDQKTLQTRTFYGKEKKSLAPRTRPGLFEECAPPRP